MDRFIENLFAPHDLESINLKSNMDRFIAFNFFGIGKPSFDLKSNMDRFIEEQNKQQTS